MENGTFQRVSFKDQECKGCHLCASVCPKKIITFDESINPNGYHPATVKEQDKCISCAMCATICPDLIITVRKED